MAYESEVQRLRVQQSQLSEAQSNIQKANNQNELARQQIEESRNKINSARGLRNQSGISGLSNRRKVEVNLSENESDINKRQEIVNEYYNEDNIAKSQVDTQINEVSGYEAALNDVDRFGDYETAREFISDPYELKYLKQMYIEKEGGEEANQLLTTQLNSGQVPDYLINKLKILENKGYTSENKVLGFSDKAWSKLGYSFRPVSQNDVQINTIDAEKIEPMSSQVLTTQNLNNDEGSYNNGLGISNGLPARNNSRSDMVLSSNVYVSDNSSSDSGGFLSGFTKAFKKQKESYSSEAGGFVSATETGERATASIRPPTPQEKQDLTTNKGISKFIFGERNILTTDLNELRRNYELTEKTTQRINKINLDINELAKNNIDIKTNQWIGSDSDYQAYQNKLTQLQNENQRINNIQTIGVGLFTQEQQDIRNFKYLTPRNKLYASLSGISAVGESLSVSFGKLGSKADLLFKQPDMSIPEVKYQDSLPYQKRGTLYYNSDKKYYVPTTEFTKKIDNANPKTFESIGRFGGRLVPYLNPYGVYIFGAEQAGKIGGEIELSNNKIGKGVVSYAKTYPFEAAGLVTGGLLKGSSILSRTVRSNKYGKYLNEPEYKITDVQTKDIVNKYSEDINRPKVSSFISDKKVDKVTVKKKGVIENTEVYPSNYLEGTVKESRWLGKISIGKKINKKLEEFKGDVTISDNYFKEVIDYGKVKKITEIKGQEGTIQLLDKKGNVIINKKIKPKEATYDLKTTQSTSDILIDTERSNQLKVLEINNRKIVKDQQGNKVIDLLNKEDLTAKKVQAQIKTDLTKQVDINKGFAQVSKDTYFTSDIIESGARKGIIQASGINGRAVIKARVGQKIEVGNQLERDISIGMKGNVNKLSVRNISPNINRKISEASSQRIIQVQVNPKKISNLDKLQETASKQLRNDIDKALQVKIEPIKKIAKEIEKSKPSQITIEQANPSYVGGEGGEASKSLYQFNPQLDNIKDVVYVPETSNFLKGQTKVNVNIPQGFDIIESKSNFNVIPKTRTSVTLNQDKEVMRETKATEIKIDSKPVMSESIKFNVDQKPRERLNENVKLNTIQNLKLNQDLKVNQEVGLNLNSKQRVKQQTNKVFKPSAKPSSKILGKPNNLMTRLANRLQEEPEFFEATLNKFGKETSLGKYRSQSEAESKLLSGLKGTLSASGKIKKNGQSIEFKNLNLFKNREFRAGKKNKYLVVQERGFRLGTRSETREINYFKKSKRREFF